MDVFRESLGCIECKMGMHFAWGCISKRFGNVSCVGLGMYSLCMYCVGLGMYLKRV